MWAQIIQFSEKNEKNENLKICENSQKSQKTAKNNRKTCPQAQKHSKNPFFLSKLTYNHSKTHKNHSK